MEFLIRCTLFAKTSSRDWRCLTPGRREWEDLCCGFPPFRTFALMWNVCRHTHRRQKAPWATKKFAKDWGRIGEYCETFAFSKDWIFRSLFLLDFLTNFFCDLRKARYWNNQRQLVKKCEVGLSLRTVLSRCCGQVAIVDCPSSVWCSSLDNKTWPPELPFQPSALNFASFENKTFVCAVAASSRASTGRRRDR